MSRRDVVLGIDTSNYTTSAAVCSNDRQILLDLRRPLAVRQGARGLRQSDALYRHMETLPLLTETVLSGFRDRIAAVTVSDRPRPVCGSYMPVFKAGMRMGAVISQALAVPLFFFSHQEGHIEAGRYETTLETADRFPAFHLSGGTSDLLLKEPAGIRKIGGSLDISFGQLIDRVGVALGLSFPAGRDMDRLACEAGPISGEVSDPRLILKAIPVRGLCCNLSGIETQALRLAAQKNAERSCLAWALFEQIGRALETLARNAASNCQADQVLFTGGVSASCFLRQRLTRTPVVAGAEIKSSETEKSAAEQNMIPVFGQAELSSDNAVGIALLGVKEYIWQ